MKKTTYRHDPALGALVEKSPDLTEASLRQIRLTCLSIAAKEAGRRGAKGDVEKRAEEMVRYVVGRRAEPPQGSSVAGPLQSLTQQPADMAKPVMATETIVQKPAKIMPEIEIRQLLDGSPTAWWKGELLPFGRVHIQPAFHRDAPPKALIDIPVMRYGEPVGLEEMRRIPAYMRERFPELFSLV